MEEASVAQEDMGAWEEGVAPEVLEDLEDSGVPGEAEALGAQGDTGAMAAVLVEDEEDMEVFRRLDGDYSEAAETLMAATIPRGFSLQIVRSAY